MSENVNTGQITQNFWSHSKKLNTPPAKYQMSQVDSFFCPLWDGKMSTSQRAVMLCGWGVKAGMV